MLTYALLPGLKRSRFLGIQMVVIQVALRTVHWGGAVLPVMPRRVKAKRGSDTRARQRHAKRYHRIYFFFFGHKSKAAACKEVPPHLFFFYVFTKVSDFDILVPDTRAFADAGY
jgi:hypothetical protein